jgi:CubicO group peptidase (beta-lactamase class C family)
VCFLLLLQSAFSQAGKPAAAKEPEMQAALKDVDDLLDRNQKLLGGSVVTLIYKDGKIVYKKELGAEFNVKTQSTIGGAGQWITAALIMSLVDEGKISLDDPVTKYIPIFASYSKKYITIRNCLSHTTGILADKGFVAGKKYSTLEDEAAGYAKKEIERNPGEMFFYSHVGPNLAGRIAEIVTKKTFDRLIQDRILRPLKMRQTNFGNDYERAIDPSAGMVTTANDYINFLAMILNKGTFEGKRVLSEKSIDEMQKMQTGNAIVKYTTKAGEGYDYGLGLWVMEKDAAGKATVVGCPAISGTWPYVDYCRGYACLFLVKDQPVEQKNVYLSIKEAIDKQMPGNCK